MSTPTHVPTAREIMRRARSLVSLQPEMPVFDAVRTLLRYKISGAPVIDKEGKLLGVCSELDCLRVLSAGEFWRDDHSEKGLVRHYMSEDFASCGPDVDIYTLAQYFLTHEKRRMLVLDGEQFVGQLSRRDVLRAMEKFGKSRVARKHYPDYREPAADVGARRSA